MHSFQQTLEKALKKLFRVDFEDDLYQYYYRTQEQKAIDNRFQSFKMVHTF